MIMHVLDVLDCTAAHTLTNCSSLSMVSCSKVQKELVGGNGSTCATAPHRRYLP
jgi:hypothetical protein